MSSRTVGLYDAVTIKQLFAFIINSQGKPEAAPNQHDDAVMSLAIAWQLFQRVDTPHVSPIEGATAERHDPYGLFAGL